MQFVAAVISDHKHDGLKQLKCITSQFWRSEVQSEFHWAKAGVSAGLCCSRKLWEEPKFLRFASLSRPPAFFVP